MKLNIVLCGLLFTLTSWAGTEVPWPITSQEAVRVSDLTGTWVSMNLKSPGYLYFFSFSANTYPYSSCPYRLTVEEMNPFEQQIVSKGLSTVCQINQSSVVFKLYDANGKLRNSLEIVGIRKDENEQSLGKQYLGVMIYNGSYRPQLVAADTFFKYSNETVPTWPDIDDIPSVENQ